MNIFRKTTIQASDFPTLSQKANTTTTKATTQQPNFREAILKVVEKAEEEEEDPLPPGWTELWFENGDCGRIHRRHQPSFQQPLLSEDDSELMKFSLFSFDLPSDDNDSEQE